MTGASSPVSAFPNSQTSVVHMSVKMSCRNLLPRSQRLGKRGSENTYHMLIVYCGMSWLLDVKCCASLAVNMWSRKIPHLYRGMLFPCLSRPASGERYLVCTGFLPPPPSPPGCRFTNALRGKVKALQETRSRRDRCCSNPSPATFSSSSWVGEASSSGPHAGLGGGGGVHDDDSSVAGRNTDRGDDSDDDGASTVDGRLDAALGVEAEMKQDESFMSYLRCFKTRSSCFVPCFFFVLWARRERLW